MNNTQKDLHEIFQLLLEEGYKQHLYEEYEHLEEELLQQRHRDEDE